MRTTRSHCQDWNHSNKELFAAIYDFEQLKKCRLFLKSVVDIYMVVAGLENKIANECRTNQWIEWVLCVHIRLKRRHRRIHILHACSYRSPPIQTEISMPIIPFIFPLFNRNGNTAPMELCISTFSRSFCVELALSICYHKRNERYLKASILLSHSPMINTSARWSYRGVFTFCIRFDAPHHLRLPEVYCLSSPSHEAST